MLDLYYHLHDDDSPKAMQAFAESKELNQKEQPSKPPFEGSLRAPSQSTIEKLSQAPEFTELTESLAKGSERGGFEPPVRLFGVRRFSKPLPSATRSPLLDIIYINRL